MRTLWLLPQRQLQDQEYDSFGNITRKTNVGNYTYSAAHPHQLQSTSDGVAYTYDNVGNMTSDTGYRTLHYTVFDKPDTISKLNNQITFAYGADRNYYKRVDSDGTTTTSTYQVGSVEKVIKPDGTYDMKRYLPGGGLWTYHFNSGGTQTSIDKQYLYKDALDSVVLITDAAGTVKQNLAYNAWGQRVNNTDWKTVLSPASFLPVSQQYTTSGYTGQDMLDAVGLIHYGGRIYDQRLGRFVQADPIVQAPTYLQSFNRYAYVMNGPLTWNDPTGFACGAFSQDEVFVCGDPFPGAPIYVPIYPTNIPGYPTDFPGGDPAARPPIEQVKVTARPSVSLLAWMGQYFSSQTTGGGFNSSDMTGGAFENYQPGNVPHWTTDNTGRPIEGVNATGRSPKTVSSAAAYIFVYGAFSEVALPSWWAKAAVPAGMGVACLATGTCAQVVKIVKSMWSVDASNDESKDADKGDGDKPTTDTDGDKGKAKFPDRGEPGETKEGPRRTREFDQEGKPKRDYDKPHQGHERPHVHEWENGGREHPGRDYSPWPRQGDSK